MEWICSFLQKVIADLISFHVSSRLANWISVDRGPPFEKTEQLIRYCGRSESSKFRVYLSIQRIYRYFNHTILNLSSRIFIEPCSQIESILSFLCSSLDCDATTQEFRQVSGYKSQRKVHATNLHLKAATILLADRQPMMSFLISVHIITVQQ